MLSTPMSKTKNTKKKARTQEIERKFLIGEAPTKDVVRRRARPISQGYLAIDEKGELEVRLRRRDDRYCLTIKQGGKQQRVEVDVPLNKAKFDTLWPMTEGRRVTKTRYRLSKIGPGTSAVDLDIYKGKLAGLRVVEVEFSDDQAARDFQAPAWFGREVTGDPAYRNASLARDGLPPAGDVDPAAATGNTLSSSS